MAPILLPGFGTKAVFDLSSSANRVEIDPMVSLGARLTRTDIQPVFDVATSHPTYYRMLSLTQFDGTRWRAGENPQSQPISNGIVPVAELAASAAFSTTFTTLSEFGDPHLPVPDQTTHVDGLDGDSMGADLADNALILDHDLGAQTTYTTTSLLIQPTIAQLAGLGTIKSPSAEFTALPPNLPRGIDDLAHAWTDSQPSSYDKVITIMDKLRSSPYKYDTTVNLGDSSTALLDFLTVGKRGFCEQFAASMAVMLRTLGIPARVVIGFTSGHLDPATHLWRITTRDAHSWVEVKFPSPYGWLTFDPTPAGQVLDSVASTYWGDRINPRTCQGGATSADCGGGGPTDPGSKLVSNDRVNQLIGIEPRVASVDVKGSGKPSLKHPGEFAGNNRWLSARKMLLGGLLLVLLVLGLVPPVRRLRRRIRLRRATGDQRRLILTSYDVFTERAAELGCPRGLGETLEEYRSRLAASELPVNGHLDRLTALTAVAAYAPTTPTDQDASDATDAAQSAWRDLRKSTPLIKRLTGAYHRG
jgi:transglutaminase-like putative cysteine protease